MSTLQYEKEKKRNSSVSNGWLERRPTAIALLVLSDHTRKYSRCCRRRIVALANAPDPFSSKPFV
jgi:hypothetical protein